MDFLAKSYNEISDYRSYPLIMKAAPTAPCAAIAIRILTGLPEEHIIDALDTIDPSWRKDGVYDHTATRIIKAAGFKATHISMKGPLSEANFRLKYPKGNFYVSTFEHAYVISNGITYDPYGPRGRRRVWKAHLIEKE